MLTRLGPALAPLLCALLVVALAVVGALVPIGRPGRTLTLEQAFAMVAGAAALATWAFAVGASAWRLSRVEGAATVLSRPLSPGVFDILFSVPLVVIVPVASFALPVLLRGGRPDQVMLLAAHLWAGLLVLREVDRTAYFLDGRVHDRAGWLWVRRESVPVSQVRGVRIDRETYRGAPSFVVRLDFADPAPPVRLASVEARYSSEEMANAEAERWRRAMGKLRSAP